MADNFKYSIQINQFAAVKNGFDLDIIDCALFDYFKDFIGSSKIPKTFDNGKTYVKLKWDKIIIDMPLLGIKSKSGMIKRVNNLVKNGLLERHIDNMIKGQSLFCIGERYDEMIFFKELPSGYKPPYPENDDTLTSNTQKDKKNSNTLTSNYQPYPESDRVDEIEDENNVDNPTLKHTDPTLKRVTPYPESSNNNTISYYNIKSNVYNSLKESENFEKKSEIVFLDGKPYNLRDIMKLEKFNAKKESLASIDLKMLKAMCSDEVSISEYEKLDNLELAKYLVYSTSVKLGTPIEKENEIIVFAESVCSALSKYQKINWQEVETAIDISLSMESHPVSDFVEEIEIPEKFNMAFFTKALSRYEYFRNSLHRQIYGILTGSTPYRIEKYNN